MRYKIKTNVFIQINIIRTIGYRRGYNDYTLPNMISISTVVITTFWIILIIFIIIVDLILFLLPVNPVLLGAETRPSHGSHHGVAQPDDWPEGAPAEISQVDLTELPEKWKVECRLNVLRQGGDLLLEVIYSLRYGLLVDV